MACIKKMLKDYLRLIKYNIESLEGRICVSDLIKGKKYVVSRLVNKEWVDIDVQFGDTIINDSNQKSYLFYHDHPISSLSRRVGFFEHDFTLTWFVKREIPRC